LTLKAALAGQDFEAGSGREFQYSEDMSNAMDKENFSSYFSPI